MRTCTREIVIFLPRLGSRMVRLSTSALPALGSVSCYAILIDDQGAVSWSMDTGVVGLTSWLRVLSAVSIAGGSLEVTRSQVVFHFHFSFLLCHRGAELESHLPLLELAGRAPARSSFSSEKMCYHRSL